MNTGCYSVGFIGDPPEGGVSYEPTDDESVFFLNTASSAETWGDVSNLSYCYSLEGGAKVKFYQATVGVYRMKGDTWNLTYSFNVTKNGTSQTPHDNTMKRADISVRFSVLDGDVLAACSRVWNDSVGRVNIVTKTAYKYQVLFRNKASEKEHLCSKQGTVPTSFTSQQLEKVDTCILLMGGAIY